jgi:hypothetical protein
MGLRSDIQAAISAAFDTDLNDAVKSITYIAVSTEYNPITGEVATHEQDFETRGVIDNEKVTEVFDEQYKPGDCLVLILSNELNYKPKLEDKLLIENTFWKIIRIKTDPANVTWEMLCRK